MAKVVRRGWFRALQTYPQKPGMSPKHHLPLQADKKASKREEIKPTVSARNDVIHIRAEKIEMQSKNEKEDGEKKCNKEPVL